MKKFKYKSSFASTVKCVLDTPNKFLSIASVDELKNVIPPNDCEDLLPFAANACVVNLGNRNGVMVGTETALSFYKKWLHKFVDVEHNREQIVGHITGATLSKFDMNYAIGAGSEPLQEADVVGNGPFNICLNGFIYKILSSDLVETILESNDPTSPCYLDVSLSWELAYDEFKIAIGGQTIDECEIIDDEIAIESYLPYLRENKGTGKLSDGRFVFKLICGEVIPLGVGITYSPAAAVKGMTIPNTENEELSETQDNLESQASVTPLNEEMPQKAKESEEKTKNIENIKNNISQSSISDVTTITTTMKVLKTFEDIKLINEDNASEYSFANIDLIASGEIERISKEYEEKITAEKTALASAQKDAEDAKIQLQTLATEVADLKLKQSLAEAEQKFNERMSMLDESFELDTESRQAIASDINGIDEASFEKWFSSFSKYAKGKCKAKSGEMVDGVKKKAKSETKASELLESTIEPAVTVTSSVTTDENPNEKYKNAFKSGEGFTITI